MSAVRRKGGTMANPDDDFRRFKRILASRNADYDFEKPQRLYLLDIDPDGQHRRRLLGDSLREASPAPHPSRGAGGEGRGAGVAGGHPRREGGLGETAARASAQGQGAQPRADRRSE